MQNGFYVDARTADRLLVLDGRYFLNDEEIDHPGNRAWNPLTPAEYRSALAAQYEALAFHLNTLGQYVKNDSELVPLEAIADLRNIQQIWDLLS